MRIHNDRFENGSAHWTGGTFGVCDFVSRLREEVPSDFMRFLFQHQLQRPRKQQRYLRRCLQLYLDRIAYRHTKECASLAGILRQRRELLSVAGFGGTLTPAECLIDGFHCLVWLLLEIVGNSCQG